MKKLLSVTLLAMLTGCASPYINARGESPSQEDEQYCKEYANSRSQASGLYPIRYTGRYESYMYIRASETCYFAKGYRFKNGR